jgi:hypothetical protein
LIFGAEEVFEDEDGILIYALSPVLELFKELEIAILKSLRF